MSTGNGGGPLRGPALEDLPAVSGRSAARPRLTPSDVRFDPPRRRRDARWIVAGVGLMALAGVVGWVVVSQLAAKYSVLVTARAVPAGHVFTVGDLRPTSTSAGGLGLLQESDEDQVVGHTAAVAIPAGAPLVRGDLGSPSVGSGIATVAVLCKQGQFPPSLAPGDHVTVLTTESAASSAGAVPGATTTAPSVAQGVVVAIDAPPDSPGSGSVITLQVDAAAAPAIAQAGADGRVSLAVTAPGS